MSSNNLHIDTPSANPIASPSSYSSSKSNLFSPRTAPVVFSKFKTPKTHTPKRTPTHQPNILSNKKLLAKFSKVTWKGRNQPELILNGTRILLKAEQVALLIEKQNQLRMERIQKAKSRGNQLMKLSKDKGYEQAVDDARDVIRALVLGYRVRRRLKLQNQKAIIIQTWWTKMMPAYRAHRIVLDQKEMAAEAKRNKLTDSQHIEFTQQQLRFFIQYLVRLREIQKNAVDQCFDYLDAVIVAKRTLRMKKYVVQVQSGIRSYLSHSEGSDDFIHVKAQIVKKRVLEMYQQFAAPYPRRAIFCFKTKNLDRDAYVFAHREAQILSKLKEPLMTPEAFRKHLSHILKTLFIYEKNMDFIKIIRTVYQPQIVFHKRKGKIRVYNYRFDGRKLSTGIVAKLFKSNPDEEVLPPIPKQDHLRIEDPMDNTGKRIMKTHLVPLSLVLKQLVKVLFSPDASLRRSDWGSVILFKYVMGDEIKNVSIVMAVEKKNAAEPEAVEKKNVAEPEVADFFFPELGDMDAEGN